MNRKNRMHKGILLTISAIATSLCPLMGSEEPLPSVQSTANWITVRSEQLLNGRKVPYSMSIRKDTIVSVYEHVLEPQLAGVDRPTTPNAPEMVPVEIVIASDQNQERFRVGGLTSATAPAFLKKIMDAIDSANASHGKQMK